MFKKIYYVEDDPTVGKMIKMSLETINDVCPMSVELFTQYEPFRETLDEALLPDLILLDLMLPTKDGYDILVELKRNPRFCDIPVVVISAKLSEYERYICLEAGAVGYFTKPFFGLLELNSAVKNFLNLKRNDGIFVCDNLAFDSSRNIATRAGVVLDLTKREFDLLNYFARNNHKACSKEDIYKNVWGTEYVKGSRSLDMHVKLLRQKVFADDPTVIKTIIRFGYKFEYNEK
ncbi:MAG: response regulator transcription factor [bacterium]